jgi:RHS repeat-associated protein
MVWFTRQLLAAILSFSLAVPAFSNGNDQLSTDTYDYDAFGNLIHQTGTTPNNYLLAGEQFDPDLNLYYNRARYLSTPTGRFWSMDTKEGHLAAPLSLHRYLYSSGDPVNRLDPSGNDSYVETIGTLPVSYIVAAFTVLTIAGACAAVAVLTRHGVGPCSTAPPEILYHYTAVNNLEGIAGSAVLLASPTGAFGPGQYFTDIRPFEAEAHTKEDLSTALFAIPNRWPDTEVGFIGVDVGGLNVARMSSVYGYVFSGKSIFLNETTVQLPLVFRLKFIGVLIFGEDLGGHQ